MTSFRHTSWGQVDRQKSIPFTYHGKAMSGYAGDTVASALMANGETIVGRSFKYHRPRGFWGASWEEPNGFFDIQVGQQHFTNCQGTSTQLLAGMSIQSINGFPSARYDIKGGLDLLQRFMPAGFYYKTFMAPDWHLFEPSIRHMAGMGRLNGENLHADSLSQKQFRNVQTLVVGAGIAGLEAAYQAAKAGQRVLLVDDKANPGGSYYGGQGLIEEQASADWIAQRLAALQAMGAEVMLSTTAFGIYDHQLVALAQQDNLTSTSKLIKLRVEHLIIATGCIDRPLLFANNDLPGICSAHAARTWLQSYGIVAGQRIGLAINHRGYAELSKQFTAAGAEVVDINLNNGPISAHGWRQLKSVKQGRQQHQLDSLLTSASLTPVLSLWSQAGGQLKWHAQWQTMLPADGPAWCHVVGSAAGHFGDAECLHSSRHYAQRIPHKDTAFVIVNQQPNDNQGRQWVDFQNDVTSKDIALAARENYTSVEHLKRYTTLGMAIDQGKSSNINALMLMAECTNKPVAAVGTTKFRPPFTPQPLSMYRGKSSGKLLNPPKRLPLEQEHRHMQAALKEYGGWLRPAWYGTQAWDQAVNQEVLHARTKVALLDATPLGKIEVMGPDAKAFLNFVYYNNMASLTAGQIRYGFMLTEKGVVFDDGVLTCINNHHYLVSCSSSHADGVEGWLEAWRQDGHNPERIFIHNTTAQWATLTITGPAAKSLMQSMDWGVDLDNLAHMQFTQGSFKQHPVRIARVSFTGHTSYEISVPSSQAKSLWHTLLEQGKPFDIAPIGLEALSVLRAEKGFIIIGKDTDGETMPQDLGFAGPLRNKTQAYIGDRSLRLEKAQGTNRQQLVGITVNGQQPLATGAHIVTGELENKQSIGYVTSSYFSPTLNAPIALALVKNGHQRMNQKVTVFNQGSQLIATVTQPTFVDLEGNFIDA